MFIDHMKKLGLSMVLQARVGGGWLARYWVPQLTLIKVPVCINKVPLFPMQLFGVVHLLNRWFTINNRIIVDQFAQWSSLAQN